MKQSIIKVILFALILSASQITFADEFEVNGMRYITLNDREVELRFGKSEKDIAIPSEVIYKSKKYRVTKIGDKAFKHSTVSTINIPNSVISIGGIAFYDCKNLKSIKLSENLMLLKGSAFKGCKSLKSIIIPKSVTYYDNTVFKDCDSLETLAFYCANATNIGQNSRRLKTLIIGEGVVSIGQGAFRTLHLESIEFPNTLESIESRAFSDCENMKSITFGNSIKSIDVEVFLGSDSLSEIIIKNPTPPILGRQAFSEMIFDKACLRVPQESIALYKSDSKWGKFVNIEGIERLHSSTGKAIKVEFGSTSVTIELKENPILINDGSNIVLETNSMSLTVSLPCKATFVEDVNTDIKEIINIRNNNSEETLKVYTLDGKMVGFVNDKSSLISLKKGIYIVNGKKIIIK